MWEQLLRAIADEISSPKFWGVGVALVVVINVVSNLLTDVVKRYWFLMILFGLYAVMIGGFIAGAALSKGYGDPRLSMSMVVAGVDALVVWGVLRAWIRGYHYWVMFFYALRARFFTGESQVRAALLGLPQVENHILRVTRLTSPHRVDEVRETLRLRHEALEGVLSSSADDEEVVARLAALVPPDQSGPNKPEIDGNQ